LRKPSPRRGRSAYNPVMWRLRIYIYFLF